MNALVVMDAGAVPQAADSPIDHHASTIRAIDTGAHTIMGVQNISLNFHTAQYRVIDVSRRVSNNVGIHIFFIIAYCA
ncbi:MAG TPA: hypothetical protein VF898_03185, partial [Chloroflexota bacterium]